MVSVQLIYAFVAFNFFGAPFVKAQALNNGADVLFVLDGSSRVTMTQWLMMRQWLEVLVSRWQIGQNNVQVGFYTYGDGSHRQYTLQQGYSQAQLQREVGVLQRVGGAPDAGQAIREAYREGFSSQSGGRTGAAKIIVHVTSGPSSDTAFLQQEIDAAKQQGVSVYRVGIGAGSSLSGGQLAKEASEPLYRYSLTSDNFHTLDSLTGTLASRVADELPTGPGASLPGSTSGCLQQADVAFVLDGSSSVGDANFQRLLSYVKTFSSQLPVSQNGVHVGLMEFSSRPSVQFGMGLYTDRASLLKAIDNVQYMGGGTNTGDALRVVSNEMFSQTMGARPNVPRIAVVITDGKSSSMANTVKEADAARQKNIVLIAVGVGNGVNTAELRDIADSSQDVIRVSDYDQLPSALQSVMQRACAVQTTARPISVTLDPSVVDPCVDKLPNCNLYDETMCTDYATFARENCARHCKICQPLLPDILPPCQDKLPNCGDYDKSMCSETQYKAWAKDNCALYCGLCGTDTSTNGYYGQCYYKRESYNTGETWYDGCDYECTCINGETGEYKCYNRCPIYKDLPATCTLVQTPGDCCLKPVCNFNPTIQTSVTSGLGQTPDGMKVCEYQGYQYVQGESWDVGCSLKCVCEDASTGSIRCQSYCPTYTRLPSNCHMHQNPGQCCSEPVCEFTTQTGSITGNGRTSGTGAVMQPTDPPPCVDKLDNCAMFTDGCSAAYVEWAKENCRAYCGLCTNGDLVPTNNDTCEYMGKSYRQGDSWDIGCDQHCVCEEAVYGYYRCTDRCPQYLDLPAECTRTPATNQGCCDTISCPSTVTLVTSSTNVLTPGSGSEILQPDPLHPGQMVPLVPTSNVPGVTVAPNPQGTHSINGCLYKGQLYVQSQRWDDGCQQVCECTNAAQGMYTCNSRCPEYHNVPAGCSLQTDPADACCKVPVCQPQVSYIPVPVYPQGTVSQGQVRPPNPNQLQPTSQTVLVTQDFPQSANSPPTLPTGSVPTGGIGFCVYKNQTYRQSETWTDGCLYNCLCQDASTGFWVCSDMCLHYPPMPQYCKLITDPAFPCCQKPHCEIPGIKNSTFGMATTLFPIITPYPPMVITTTDAPRPAMCVYKGQEYSQGQEWYDGCDYKCTCYDATSNLYSCTNRCPTFFGLDESRCTQKPDPQDPACCTVPVCQPLSTPAAGTTPVPTAPGGSFEVTNTPGIGYCDYKGTHYQQGDSWTDGCLYTCQCLDSHNGRYRCDERCPRFPDLPSACRLVTDFANPCCKKPTCDFNPFAGTISGQANLHTPAPAITPAPGQQTPVCNYKGGLYNEGQTWDDGCNLKCRCENAEQGVYVCVDRCPSYGELPAECVLVADPNDQCCRVPQCKFTPTSGQQTGHGQTPVPFPTPAPGHISGQINVPTPAPGATPPPVGYCVYKGQQYAQGARWQDGCQYDCVCEDANVGKYVCTERCAQYPNLPAECRLFKDPVNPCCMKPDCTFTPNAGQITGQGTTQAPLPGSTVAPPLGPDGSTLNPPFVTTQGPTPSPAPVCMYRGQVYAEGQTWYDGCDYVCVCEVGSQGTYRCNDRCSSYLKPEGSHCTTKPDPEDPMCCVIPECDTPMPTPLSPNGPYIVPTIAPQGVVTGGSVTPTPGPVIIPTPGPDGSTLSPPVRSTPAPKAVCLYKGHEYGQDQKWQDGCDYNCQCVDAASGHYKCTETCPRYPPMPAGCYMVRDVYNPCCQTPVCPFPPAQATSIAQPTPGVTQAPPTAPDGHTLMPPMTSTPAPVKMCLYNGVPYRTGDTWDDGCDLKCRCEDENANVYRCDQRCPRYHLTPGCTMVTDPRDSCCLAPFCVPQPNPTLAPNPNNPNQPATPSPYLIPTAIPGKIVGNSVNVPNTHNPNNQTMCVYDNSVYKQGDTWIDGCDYTCVCTDQSTGRYECSERCPPYLNVPSNCFMAVDPNDECCKKPVCANPITQAPNPGTTVAPQPGQVTLTPVPGSGSTVAPQPSVSSPLNPSRNTCVYKNAVYIEGQQWYDGCDKVCVCEDGATGYYRCTDRCTMYQTVPSGCTLVVDPKDPACCKVPQCAPTPGPLGFPTLFPGQSPTPYTVTNVPGFVTGRAPTPTPGTDGQTPQPTNACVYRGHMYARGQRWQDGCDYNCVCENEITGEYKCTERCNTYPLVPPQCRLERDPADYCCRVMRCDPTASTPNPYLTPAPQVTQSPIKTPAPQPGVVTTLSPQASVTPRPVPGQTAAPSPGVTPQPSTQAPVPTEFCVYKGAVYGQGDTWTEGCSKTCRCDNADTNHYTCFDRCPSYNNLDPACTLTLDPKDQCCQMPLCPAIPTATPTPQPPGQTPVPAGATTPAPAVTPTPFPVPQKVPTGSITGVNPHPNPNLGDVCVYKGTSYRQGQKWADGCAYNCTCIDERSGRYLCDEQCDQYTNLPSYCVLVKDTTHACCMKPLCTPPATQAPPRQQTSTPPGTATLVPPVGGQTTPTSAPGFSTQSPPLPSVGVPTPSLPSVCVMNGKTYTQGQQWYDGCNQICVCDDATTGFYTCRQRCPDYPGSDPTCLVVPDPSDPACCTMPQCPDPLNPQNVTGHKGTITGHGHPPTPSPYVTPAPGQTLAPNPGSTVAPQSQQVCIYKGQQYATGQRWRDGCDYECVCEDGLTGRYKCVDRCNKYPATSALCPMKRDPNDPCCRVPDCSPTPAPSLSPNQTPAPGNPNQPATPSPYQVPNTAVCVYQGVPYRQGQTWNDGCDKVCRCEDGMTGRVNCDDRCPKYPLMQAGCTMVTDPQDSCCQIPKCNNPNTNEPTKVVTGVPGTIEGNSLPPQNPNPLQPRASVCIYRGVEYQQGQTWDDGCSYTCVCEDGLTGHYRCTERCPRVPDIPSTCFKTQNPSDMCCQLVSCPVSNPATPAPTATPFPPTPYHGPSTVAPPTTLAPGVNTAVPNPYVTPQPTPRPGMCLYKNQYYREQQVWYDDCDAICTCEDGNTGFYRCQARCGDYPNVDNSCIMVPDPKDPTCCKMPECPLIPPGGTTPSGPAIVRPPQPTAVITNFPTPGPQTIVTRAPPLGPDGHTLAPPMGSTQTPSPRTGCLYNGRIYQENERWTDGCNYNCVCLSEITGQYKCWERCARVPSVPAGCVLIQDPNDACCEVPYCDFGPNPFPNGVQTPTPNPSQVPPVQSTTPYYVIPGFVTANGQNTTPKPPTSIGGSTDVCVYQGVIYRQGDTWNQACDKTCVCDDAKHGLYTCRDRCADYGQLGPACVLRANPADPCCLVPDCNPNYVTPVPGTGLTGSNVNITPGTGPGTGGSNVTPQPGTGFTGSNINVSPGSGPTISGSNVTPVPGSGITGSNPFPVTGQVPGISGTRAPVLVPTAAPATFTGQRPSISPNAPGAITGYSSSCVYKGVAYSQGSTWEDGCQYRCECIDAQRGTYRCTERCSSMYFIPPSCTLEQDPNDSCCQRARCSPDAFPTPTLPATLTPQAGHTVAPPTAPTTTRPSTVKVTPKPGPVFQGTRTPLGSTVASFTGKPPSMCVYTDGRTFSQGQTWTDGCAYNCKCEDAPQNVYKCDFRCPAYSDLPANCSLVKDPTDQCCQKVYCQPVLGQPLVPVIGNNRPTVSPTMVSSVTNVIPIGTHSIISGSGLVPGENTPGFFGGRKACIYKGAIYQSGETWDDGCDYTCQCLVNEPGVYQCASKCPKFPPLPQYCSTVSVPGQCCPSVHCDVPNVGSYIPTPQLEPSLIPTGVPNVPVPQTNPQVIIPGNQGPITGGQNLPGGGTVVPVGSLSGVRDMCIYQGTDGQYRLYAQGEKWRVNQCDYDCECVDARSGYYHCTPVCPDFNHQGQLPDSCRMEYVTGQCCPALRCTNPDGTVVDYTNNPSHTYVPVYGVTGSGYSGFKPGYLPGQMSGYSAQNHVCVYKGLAYSQSAKWDDGCDFSCECTDASTGLYTCTRKCQKYTSLPPVCHFVNATTDCCPKVQCDRPPTTAPLVPSSPAVTTSAGDCVATDKLDNCHSYDKATACAGVYAHWARENCPVYCGICKDAHPTPAGPCVDVLDNCDAFGPQACTGLYLPWARDNCMKTCNLCPCEDKLTNCDQYGRYSCAGSYEQWARENCKKTCGYCPGDSATTQPQTQTCSAPAGQTLLLKGVAGAPGDLWQLWSSPNTANANVDIAKTLDNSFPSHYKSDMANNLDMCDFDTIKVAIYSNCQERASVTFNARGAGRNDWFTPSRILTSSYNDLTAQFYQHFQLAGDPATGREFYVGGTSHGCTGTGWFFVSTRDTCQFEAGPNPGFFYATGNSAQSMQAGNFNSGDVLAVLGEGGTCAQGITTPHTNTGHANVCVYKQHIYQQGQWWQDGCQYNCTCEDGTRGFYRCYDLCKTYTGLPPNCPLIKNPGECCATPSCMQPGHTVGCMYKSNIYQPGQTWNDGCDYKCTCKDGSTGRYECTSRCLQFNLPSECHMDPAPAGKCCQVPVCPSNIHIQYPPGYVPE